MQIKKNYREAGPSRGIRTPSLVEKITHLENKIGAKEKPVRAIPKYPDWLKNA